ncbi:MAG: tetratricopeptide repeat protein [Deltaproteobacteria bacterium]|nr:tetratricopeptide repeat protein [Deltaproteobacteria bacterium]
MDTDDDRGGEEIPRLGRLLERDAGPAAAEDRHQALAATLEAQGDLAGAVAQLEEARKADGGNVAVLFALGRLYLLRHDLEPAARALRSLLLLKLDGIPRVHKADVYCLLARIHVEKGEPRKALSMAARGLESKPDHQDCKSLVENLERSA